MPLPIEHYALIGDTQTAALVGMDGSIDWLCLPRFDSPACFAALLGDPSHGRWLLAPADEVERVERRYRGDTLVLETDFHTASGVLQVVDSMPIRDEAPDVVRVARCLEGRVSVRMELVLRFDIGRVIPWVQRADDGGLMAIAGPDAIHLIPGRPTRGRDFTTVAEFDLAPGDEVPFVLTWYPSHEPVPSPVDGLEATHDTTAWWEEWSARSTATGPHRDLVQRSLITLKALTYAPTGGIAAAPTASLPEQLGGVRNWDYRFYWVRDATLTLQSLLHAGYTDEARAWRDWLLRAVAGSPAQMQIMCSFWLADCLTLIGRNDEARSLFDRLIALANDVGLLAEEYDPRLRRQVGNFPQAFTHVGLVNSAMNLDRASASPAEVRAEHEGASA